MYMNYGRSALRISIGRFIPPITAQFNNSPFVIRRFTKNAFHFAKSGRLKGGAYQCDFTQLFRI